MTTSPVEPDWDEALPTDPQEEYRAIVRALRRTQGFGLLFVRCSPNAGEKLIQQLKVDLPQKSTAVLRFDRPLTDGNLYGEIEAVLNETAANILFVQGLEHSFLDYEESKKLLSGWSSEDIYDYSWKGVPRILTNLNQQRESFRDRFNTCIVFLIPEFVLKYLIRRAPDFFDWRSGVFQLASEPDEVERSALKIIDESDYEKYCDFTPLQRQQKLLEIHECFAELNLPSEYKADLWIEQGLVLATGSEYDAAIASYDQATKIAPDYHYAWSSRGLVLEDFGHKEAAIASYDQAIKIAPDYYYAWYSRGRALSGLGRKEEAIASYDQAIKIAPDYYHAWYSRGRALSGLGRKEEAIASYDQAIKIAPDYHYAWNNRGIALSDLGRTEEVITSYDQAIKIAPDYHYAWYNKACFYATQNKLTQALECLEKAIKLAPECREWAKTDADFDAIRQSDRFQERVEGDRIDNLD